MSFKTTQCFVIVCDGGCLDPWEEGTPHFDTEAEAIEYVKEIGWLVTDQRALCGQCSATTTCRVTGHQWDDWCDDERAGIRFRRRYCDRCSADEYDPPFEELYPRFQALRDAEEIVAAAERSGDAR